MTEGIQLFVTDADGELSVVTLRWSNICSIMGRGQGAERGERRASCTPTSTRSSPRSSSATTRAARPPGDRRRRGRAGGQLRGQGVRRPHRDGRSDRRSGCARTPSSCRRASRPTPRRARPSSRSSTTPRRSSRASRSTRRSSTSAGCAGIVGDPRAIAAPPARAGARARSACRSRSASPAPSSSPRSPARSAKPDGLLLVPPDGELAFLHPLPVERLWGVGADHRREAARRRASAPSATGRARRGDRWSRSSGRRAGRHLHALAHLRDPRPVRSAGAGARSGPSARSAAAPAQRRRSSTPLLVGLVDRVARRLRGGRRASAAPSRCGCASTTSPARPARPRCPRSTAATATWLETGRGLLPRPLAADRGARLHPDRHHHLGPGRGRARRSSSSCRSFAEQAPRRSSTARSTGCATGSGPRRDPGRPVGRRSRDGDADAAGPPPVP